MGIIEKKWDMERRNHFSVSQENFGFQGILNNVQRFGGIYRGLRIKTFSMDLFL